MLDRAANPRLRGGLLQRSNGLIKQFWSWLVQIGRQFSHTDADLQLHPIGVKFEIF